MSFKRYNGRAFHTEVVGNVKDQLAKIAEYKCCNDDVILCTFPKSGTHWVYNIMHMLRTGTLQFNRTPIVMSLQELSEIDALRPPRTYLTHLSYPFILNDAKNVFVLGGSWFTYLKEWEEARRSNKNLKILCIRYEDLKADLYSNIVKIAEFLELNHTETFVKDVEQKVSFENLKKENAKKGGESGRWADLAGSGRLPIYRKGIIGDWKNTFTVAQNENFDAVYRKRIEEMDLDIRPFVFE